MMIQLRLTLGGLLVVIFTTTSLHADLVVATGEQATLAAGEYTDPITNNGVVVAPTGSAPLTLTGLVDGAGRYVGDFTFDGHFSPGNSPAVVPFSGGLNFGAANTLTIELAGTALGEFDRLEVTGNLALDGMLQVELISPFMLSMSQGQTFEIIDVGMTRMGTFIGLDEGDLVGNFSGVDLFISYAGGDGNDIVLSSVPESSLVGAVGVALACLVGWWSTLNSKQRSASNQTGRNGFTPQDARSKAC